MEFDGKKCSRCQKFKSAQEFYRQGDRLESLCKSCKRQTRSARHKPMPEAIAPPQPPSEPRTDQPPKSYEDLGFTKEEFLEIADFFKELMRLDKKGRET